MTTARFSRDEIEHLRQELVDFLDPSLEDSASAIQLGNPAEVWIVDEEALLSERFPVLQRVARPLDVFHHQLLLNRAVIGYARSAIRGGVPTITETGDSALAQSIEDRLSLTGTPDVAQTRLLEVPHLQIEALWLEPKAKDTAVAVLRCPADSPVQGGTVWPDRQFCVRLKRALGIAGVIPSLRADEEPSGEHFRVGMDARWWLDDMGDFSKSFTEAYSFIYWSHPRRRDRARGIFEQFPWLGGWSRVDFYQGICAAVPQEHKPAIRSIAYSSPGNIVLAVDRAAAEALGATLRHLLRNADVAEALVNRITGDMKKKKLRSETETIKDLDISDVTFISSAAAQLASLLQIDLSWLNELSKDPLVSLKMLVAHYLRLSPLIGLLKESKIRLSEE